MLLYQFGNYRPMRKQVTTLHYFIGILVFLIIVLSGYIVNNIRQSNSLSIFNFKHKKSYQKDSSNKSFIKDDIQNQESKIYFKTFNILIDLSVEIRNYFNTAFVNNIDKKTNIDDFIKDKIRCFAASEVKFERISKDLESINNNNETINKIAKIVSNFSSLSKRYIDMSLMFENNVGDLAITAIRSRNDAETLSDWKDLQIIVSQFTEKYRKFLTLEEKNNISTKIRDNFQQNVDLFRNTLNEKGIEAALGLSFSNGEWLPINILLNLNIN